jgi:hypothetical protein
VNPGSHVIVVTAADGRTDERTIRPASGETAELSIDLGHAARDDEASAGGGPWLAIGLAAGGAALVAGVVLAIFFATSADGPLGDALPRPDPQRVYPIVEALSF